MSENGFLSKLKSGLSKTGKSLFGGIFDSSNRVNDDFYESLEESLIIGDVGIETASKLLGELKTRLKQEKISDASDAKKIFSDMLADFMQAEQPDLNRRAVYLIVGVNGVGKTTTIGKLANMFVTMGKNPVLAAGDTFRAAASEQLSVWAQRCGVPLIRHADGSDPAAVAFDAAASFKAKNKDVLICDTAGRLHTKHNLMEELAKIRRVLVRELPDIHIETLLVLDATTGQNAISQAKQFFEFCDISGVIITKLDGTAKGGMAFRIKDELNVPIRFIGVGEGIDDILPFDAVQFSKALFE